VPQAELTALRLPHAPKIELLLIDGNYPQSEFSVEQLSNLLEAPPYWAFCWASGHVLARYLLDNPELVRDELVVDFGSGSGVVAIAAAMAGAADVIAVDTDPNALLASRLNAQRNNVNIRTASNETELEIDKSKATLLIADVFYDTENIVFLRNFIEHYSNVIVADSRVAPNALKGLHEAARYKSCTLPDLDEANTFNSVGVYRLEENSSLEK